MESGWPISINSDWVFAKYVAKQTNTDEVYNPKRQYKSGVLLYSITKGALAAHTYSSYTTTTCSSDHHPSQYPFLGRYCNLTPSARSIYPVVLSALLLSKLTCISSPFNFSHAPHRNWTTAALLRNSPKLMKYYVHSFLAVVIAD